MKYMLGYLFTGLLLSACHSNKSNSEVTDTAAQEVITPVTVVTMQHGPMEEVAVFNATSAFQQKWIIKSNVTGYLRTANVALNKFVGAGQALFTIQTKEAQSIGNTINKLDPSFRFTGQNVVHANGSGFISEVNHQVGDYVQDGEQLAVVTDTKSFVFLLDLPYEMQPFITGKQSVSLLLPNGDTFAATIGGIMPVMDSAAQTQRVVLKVHSSKLIPENLVAKVQLVKHANSAAGYLPKAAVLSDETQADFWVMKMINDSTAVKVPVQKGIETANNIEILSPVFSANDRILLTGNFAMADTARVTITATPVK